MKKHIFSRLISAFLVLCMMVTTLSGLSVFAEDSFANTDTLWQQIEALRDGVLKKSDKVSQDDFALISDDVFELVEKSGTAKAGSLMAKGDFIQWIDESGVPCCYSPAHEADKAGAASSADKEALTLSLTDMQGKLARGGCPTSLNVGLIQPFWDSESNYSDSSFCSYSPYYKSQAQSLADFMGGSLYRYTMSNATADTIANTLENCGLVIFDSHGGTDYSNGDDNTSQANCSYLWLDSGLGDSSSFISSVDQFLDSTDYSATHVGTYGEYQDVYLSSDGSYCISGQVIANHMTQNAPNSLLYMGICLGMATDGMHAPLREKGVEAVYGYSQSVTFAGEIEYMQSVTNSLMGNKTLAEAVASAKQTIGVCDPYESTYPAYPIVVSTEDAYPGQGNVDAVQTVNSTWMLGSLYSVNAFVNDDTLGSVTVSGRVITASPAEGYYVSAAEVTEGTGTCTINGNSIVVNCSTDCSVLVTFSQKPEVTLSFSGIEAEAIVGTADGTVTLPSAAAAYDGYTFLGWTTSCVEKTEAKPTFLKPGSVYTLPYEDVTLYALYSYVDHNGTPSDARYVKVTSQEMLEEGSYLIGCDGSGLLTFNGGLDSPNVSGNYQVFSYSATDTVASNAETDACAVKIAPISETSFYRLTLKNGEGKYMGSTGSSTGINTKSTEPYPTAIAVSNGYAVIANTSGNNTYHFRFNNASSSNKFAFYKSSTGNAVSLYKKMDAVAGTLYYTGTPILCDHEGASSSVTAPTCTEAGYTTFICANCGYKWEEAGESATGHNYIATVTAPTASEQGYTTHVCANCNDTYIDNYIDPLGVAYQVTYNILGNVQEPVAVNSFSGTVLPIPEVVPDGYQFAGWSETELPEESVSANILTGTYKPSANVTLYAVYSRSESYSGNGNYVKVTAEPEKWDGQYLVVYEGGSIAFNGNSGTSATALNKAGNYLSVVISSDTIAQSDALDAASVKIASVSGTANYSILLNCNKYLGFTGSSTSGMNVNQSTVYQNTIGWNGDGTVKIANASGTNICSFRYNYGSSSNRFAFYSQKSTTCENVSLYKKDLGGTTYYYTTAPATAGCEHQNYSETVTAPTCTEGGYTTCICTNCGYTWTDNPVSALGHAFDEGVVTAPTAEAFGYTTYTCQREGCGYSYQDHFTGLDYQIVFSISGSEQDPVTVNGYDGMELPTEVAAVDGYTFVGWAEDVIDPETDTANVLTGVYKPTADATLFAVYARDRANTGSGDYIKMTNGMPIVNGEYLIVYEEGLIAFNGASETVDAKGNYFSIEIQNNTIAQSTEADAAAVTIKPISGTAYYSMQVSSGKYIGNLGSSTGINSNIRTVYENSISVGENDVAKISNVSGANIYNLCYNSADASNKFAFYKPTNSSCKDVALYYKDGSGYTTYFTTSPVICAHENVTSTVTPPTCTEAGFTTFICSDCGYSWTEAGDQALGHDYAAWISNEDGTHSHTCQRETCGYVETKNCTYGEDHICTACGFEQPSVILSYSVIGSVTEETVYGSTTLPATAREVEGYTFVGWAEAEIDSETTEVTVLTGKFTPQDATTLYALYVRTETVPDTGSGTGNYVKITDTADLTEGKYLAVYEDGLLAFNGAFADTSTEMNKAGNYLTVAISEQTIADTYVIDRAALTIAPVEGTEFFSMKVISDKFIGNTGSSYGINMNAATVYENAISIDADGYALITNAGSTTTGEYTNLFCYNSLSTSNRFGFYNPEGANSNKLSLYKKDGTGPDKVYYYTTNPIVTEVCTHENTQLSGNDAATCTEPGYTGDIVCVDCGIVITEGEVLPATGHIPVTDAAVAPTCTETGLTEGSHCSVCNEVLVEQEIIPAVPHTYTEAETVAATCTQDGSIEWECSVCGESYTETISATGHSYTYTNKGDGTHAVGCANCDYSAVEDHTFTDGSCICGAVESTDPIVDNNLKFTNHSLTLGDSIAINFVIKTSYLTYDSYRIVIEKDKFDTDGNVIGTETYEFTSFEVYNATYSKVVFSNLIATEMGTMIRATIYGTKDGVVYTGGTDTYSVATYALNQLNKTSADAKLKTLCADLLNYGAAAQIYKVYNTANLVNAQMSDDHAVYASDFHELSLENIASRVNNADATLTWAGNSLDMQSKVEMLFVFNVPAGSDLSKISVTTSYTDPKLGKIEKTYSGDEIQLYSTNRYKVTVDTLYSYDMSVPVTAVLYYDGVEQGTAVYSIESYAKSSDKYLNGTPLGNCVGAMLQYGYSAVAYFGY